MNELTKLVGSVCKSKTNGNNYIILDNNPVIGIMVGGNYVEPNTTFEQLVLVAEESQNNVDFTVSVEMDEYSIFGAIRQFPICKSLIMLTPQSNIGEIVGKVTPDDTVCDYILTKAFDKYDADKYDDTVVYTDKYQTKPTDPKIIKQCAMLTTNKEKLEFLVTDTSELVSMYKDVIADLKSTTVVSMKHYLRKYDKDLKIASGYENFPIESSDIDDIVVRKRVNTKTIDQYRLLSAYERSMIPELLNEEIELRYGERCHANSCFAYKIRQLHNYLINNCEPSIDEKLIDYLEDSKIFKLPKNKYQLLLNTDIKVFKEHYVGILDAKMIYDTFYKRVHHMA